MSVEKVREYFKNFGYEDKILEFKENSSTVSEAALILSCEEGMIAKSLSFLIGDVPIIIVVSGDKKIDNSKYKKFFNCKAKMINRELVKEIIGHEVGGVCPFAIHDNVLVYLDCSLKKYEYVYPACGSIRSAIKLSIEELEDLSNYKEWIDVCK